MAGDATLFMRRDAVEASWTWVTDILDALGSRAGTRWLPEYRGGHLGPARSRQADPGRQPQVADAADSSPPDGRGSFSRLNRIKRFGPSPDPVTREGLDERIRKAGTQRTRIAFRPNPPNRFEVLFITKKAMSPPIRRPNTSRTNRRASFRKTTVPTLAFATASTHIAAARMAVAIASPGRLTNTLATPRGSISRRKSSSRKRRRNCSASSWPGMPGSPRRSPCPASPTAINRPNGTIN